MVIRPRRNNELLVFSYDCTPDETTHCNIDCIGAEVQCYMDVQITNEDEFAEAARRAREFIRECGWIIEKQAQSPWWIKTPGLLACLFSKAERARRIVCNIARQDGISLIAYTWKDDNTEPEVNK